jgi:hypothetical protein
MMYVYTCTYVCICVTVDGVWTGDWIIHHLQIITTTHTKPSQYVLVNRFPVTDPNNGDSSASVLMSLLSGEYPTTELFFQLTNSQSGGHLTPTYYTSLHRLIYNWLLLRVRVESDLLYDWRFTPNQFILATSPK